MKRLFALILSVLLIFGGVLAVADALSVTTYSVAVVVHDQFGGAVEGASVTLRGVAASFSSVTDSDGVCVFQLKGYELGNYLLTVVKEGYSEYSGEVMVPSSALEKDSVVEVTLEKNLPSHYVVLSLEKDMVEVDAGSSGSIKFSVHSNLDGVRLSVCPAYAGVSGVSAVVSPDLGDGNFSGVVSFTVNASVPAGNYTWLVKAEAGGCEDAKTVVLVVHGSAEEAQPSEGQKPDFVLILRHPQVKLRYNCEFTFSVVVRAVNGFNRTVSLSLNGLPEGITCSFNPKTGVPTFISVVKLTADETVERGWYNCTLVAVSGSLKKEVPLRVGVEVDVKQTCLSLQAGSRNITLGQSVELYGSLLDEDGNPIPNARIILKVRGTGEDWHNLAEVSTSSKGCFSYTWCPEQADLYYVKALYLGDRYYTPCESLYVTVKVDNPDSGGGGEETSLKLKLDKASCSVGKKVHLTAKLTDEDGDPISGELINFYYSTDGGKTWTCFSSDMTNKEGKAEATYIPQKTGVHLLKAVFDPPYLSGYQPSSDKKKLQVTGGGGGDGGGGSTPFHKLTVTVTAKHADTGDVFYVSGAEVVVKDSSGEEVASGKTNADGEWSYKLREGSYTVEVTPPSTSLYEPDEISKDVKLDSDKDVGVRFTFGTGAGQPTPVYIPHFYNPLGLLLGLNVNPDLELLAGIAFTCFGVVGMVRLYSLRREE